MPPSSEPTERKAANAMSLSAISSAALSISSLSDNSNSKKRHKRKESGVRGEVFVSSFEASIDGSSISSESAKSTPQETALPARLLGNHENDTATATGSSTGFPSLAHSGSSLSSNNNQSSPVLALTVSRASDALRELNNGIQQQEQQHVPPTDNFAWDIDSPCHETSQQQLVVLENVEYVTSLPHASSCTDLSTLEEPITKEMASDVFSRRIVPTEIVPKTDQSEDVSTIYGGKHQQVEHDVDDDDQEAHDIDVEQGMTGVASTVEVQITIPWYQPILGRRSRVELFFIAVIGVSSSILIVLLIIVLR